MRARTFILAVVMTAVVECAKPTKEMLKLQRSGPGKNTGDLKPQRLREPYLCEGCRLVLEEVDQQIQTEISLRQKRGDRPGQINPRSMLSKICHFSDPKLPARYRARMEGFAAPYRLFCEETMRDIERRQALVDTIAGGREDRASSSMTPFVGRTRQFCVRRLGLCPAARYREPRDACDACRKLVLDMDDMLSRTPAENMTAALAAEHIEYQCETLPYRFVGTKKPTNTLETVCQEITESYDDDMLAAALMPTARERRRALAQLCDKSKAGYCDARHGGYSGLDTKKRAGRKKRRKRKTKKSKARKQNQRKKQKLKKKKRRVAKRKTAAQTPPREEL